MPVNLVQNGASGAEDIAQFGYMGDSYYRSDTSECLFHFESICLIQMEQCGVRESASNHIYKKYT